MEGLARRPSGVYVVRLSVPLRLRPLLGKWEMIASTKTTELAIAKIVAGEYLSQWRRMFNKIERSRLGMDVQKIAAGTPALLGVGRSIPVRHAALLSGMDEDELLRQASLGRFVLKVRVARLTGALVPWDELEREGGLDGGYVVPSSSKIPTNALPREYSGVLEIDRAETRQIATILMVEGTCRVVLLVDPVQSHYAFVPEHPLSVSRETIEVDVDQVERLRQTWAATITPDQIAAATNSESTNSSPGKRANSSIKDAAAAFLKDHEGTTRSEQHKRTQQACDLFAELTGNPRISEVTRDMLRRYRDEILPTVPMHEHRVRAKFGTVSVSESIAAVADTDWPKVSAGEIDRRVAILARLFTWLSDEGWIAADPARGLAGKGAAKPVRKAAKDKRHAFSEDELFAIFTQPWFETGGGRVTRAGTFRTFLPSYYWIPLLGLYTGCRLNELCQLKTTDLRTTSTGNWYLDLVDDGEDGIGKRRVKTAAGRRAVPLHPRLIELGLLGWRDKLVSLEHDRLFPELRWDEHKGPSKDASKWFTRVLQALGWERDGSRTFHSFRHTVITKCMNDLGMPETVEAQLFGHARRGGVGETTYRKDLAIDGLVPWINRISFDLPQIAQFDLSNATQALRDAMARKRRNGAKRQNSHP